MCCVSYVLCCRRAYVVRLFAPIITCYYIWYAAAVPLYCCRRCYCIVATTAAAWLLIFLGGWSSFRYYYILLVLLVPATWHELLSDPAWYVMQFGKSRPIFCLHRSRTKFHSFVPKAKRNLRNNENVFVVYRCLKRVGYHTTDRPEPYTTDSLEKTGRHSQPQAILEFIRRIKLCFSKFDIKRSNSHGWHREVYALDPFARLTLRRCPTKRVIPYSL